VPPHTLSLLSTLLGSRLFRPWEVEGAAGLATTFLGRLGRVGASSSPGCEGASVCPEEGFCFLDGGGTFDSLESSEGGEGATFFLDGRGPAVGLVWKVFFFGFVDVDGAVTVSWSIGVSSLSGTSVASGSSASSVSSICFGCLPRGFFGAGVSSLSGTSGLSVSSICFGLLPLGFFGAGGSTFPDLGS